RTGLRVQNVARWKGWKAPASFAFLTDREGIQSSTGNVRHVTTPTPTIHSTDRTSHSRNSPRATRKAMGETAPFVLEKPFTTDRGAARRARNRARMRSAGLGTGRPPKNRLRPLAEL